MKKHRSVKHILIIALCFFLVVVLFSRVLVDAFISFGINPLYAKFYSRFILRTLIIVLSLITIRKYSLQDFNGFSDWFYLKHIQAWIGIILLLIIVITTNQDLFKHGNEIVGLFIISTAAVAFAEELVFRALVLPLFVVVFRDHSYPLLKSVISSATIFGLGHYLNLFNESSNFLNVTNQVVMAVSIAVLFGSIMIRSRNIIIVGILHTLINTMLGQGILSVGNATDISTPIDISYQFKSILISIIILFVSIIISYLIIRNVNNRSLLKLISKI